MMQLFQMYGMFGLQMYGDWALAALRIVIAMVFLAHGLPKLKNLRQTAENFTAMGFAPGMFWGTLAACVEFFGGLGILAGLFTPLFATLFVVEMFVVIIWKMRRGQGLVGGYELDLVLLATALALAAFGSGALSVDAWILNPYQASF